MSQHDTTRLVNLLDRPFLFHFNNEPYELEAGEEKIWPTYICRIGAKHMLDVLLQNLPAYHNTKISAPTLSSLTQGAGWQDTPEQADFLRRIIPDWYGKNEIVSKPAVANTQPNVDLLKEQIASLTSLVTGLQEKISQLVISPAPVAKTKGRPPKSKRVPNLKEAIEADSTGTAVATGAIAKTADTGQNSSETDLPIT